jgi:hypothetical protein
VTSVVSVKVDGHELERIVKQLAIIAEGRELRKQLNSSLRKATDEVMREEKKAVLGLSSKGERTNKQTAIHAANTLKGKKEISLNKFDKAVRTAGLRQSVANAIGRTIRYQGKDVGVRIRARASKMPAGMSRLPKKMNKGKWVHPVLGNRNVWVGQRVNPPGWFDQTNRRMFPKIQSQVEAVVREYADKAFK